MIRGKTSFIMIVLDAENIHIKKLDFKEINFFEQFNLYSYSTSL
jgi:hypothetical protein